MKAIKETVRKYYKYQYNTWTQPILSADGTLGGSYFAVSASVSSGFPAYWAFSGTATWTSVWGDVDPASGHWYIFYNPNKLNISTLQIQNSTYVRSDIYPITSGTLKGSNDGTNWTTITTFTNSDVTAGSTWTIPNVTGIYKYWKLDDLSNYPCIGEFHITATEQTIIEGTSSDYDFYEDVDVYKVVNDNGTYKGVNETNTTYTLSWTYGGVMSGIARLGIVTVNGTDYAYATGTTSVEISQGSTVTLSLSTSGGGNTTYVTSSTDTTKLPNNATTATFTMTGNLSFTAYTGTS